MCSLRDVNEKLVKKGVKVYGVSFDTVSAQKAFVEKQELPFELLADVKGRIIKAFGVPSLGKFASRQAYLFKDGKLVWKDAKASAGSQGEDLLQALEALE
ncbi:MAG TPA: hypothetical protein DD438_10515 [Verrucomicrobiales bacterium]|nr:hypothetical protein [Roseibacillus sp.]HBM78533.1 hypothetical protein [Verrucomicrobiales bacterium]